MPTDEPGACGRRRPRTCRRSPTCTSGSARRRTPRCRRHPPRRTRSTPGWRAGTCTTTRSGWPSRRASWSATPGSTATGWTTCTSSPPAQGTGVGSRAARPGQGPAARTASACGSSRATTPARAFYRHHGLVELERTDGAGNEEKAPDIRMAWPGADPLAFYRGLIDEVDGAARRPAQPPGGADPRRPAAQGDRRAGPDREREIAARHGAAGARRWARTGSPGSCTRSSPRASTPLRRSVDQRTLLPYISPSGSASSSSRAPSGSRR